MKPDNIDALTEALEKFAAERGSDLCGVADLSPVGDLLARHSKPLALRFPRAVSLGMRINDAIAEGHSPEEPRRQSLYWHHVYEVVTRALDALAYDVSRWLENRGWKTFPVPASVPYDYEKLESLFPHKTAAHLAGLGWIGKNCMLVTNRFGPRVRLVTVLTDAPLRTGAALPRRCGTCRVCVEACPVHAFTGADFRVEDERAVRFDAFACSAYRRDHPCGVCVSSCPRG